MLPAAAVSLRRGVASLTTLAAADLAAVWREVETAAEARTALGDILPGLIDAYGAAAATLAADWYDDLRAKDSIAGSFTAIPADLPDTGAQALLGWALTEATDLPAFQELVLGGTQRRVANFSRLTVTGSTIADPQARGWQRVGTGECGFCRMLIGRGAVYSEASADFGAHDHCKCSAVPSWKGQSVPVKPYTPSSRGVSDADRARARDWIANH